VTTPLTNERQAFQRAIMLAREAAALVQDAIGDNGYSESLGSESEAMSQHLADLDSGDESGGGGEFALLSRVKNFLRGVSDAAGDVPEWNEGGEGYEIMQALRELRV
jgi:hypothetical protein